MPNHPEAPDRIWLMLGPQRAGGSIDAVVWLEPANNPEDSSTPYLLSTPPRLAADQMLVELKELTEAASAYAAAIARGGDVERHRERLEARYNGARAAIAAAQGEENG